MEPHELLPQLPKVDRLLTRADMVPLVERFGRWQVRHWIRQALDECRSGLRNPAQESAGVTPSDWVVERIRQLAEQECRSTMQEVVNATGVILHTNLGRAPLADRAIRRMVSAAASTNLELDLTSGKRGQRGARVQRLLCELTGAEASLVVNNCAAATLLVLHVIACQREVVISRGQLIEIGGKFRLPEVFQSAGAILREVGTTNRTYVHDYRHAIGEQTAAVMRVHHSNFAQLGFTTEPTIAELASGLQLPPSVPLIDDVGSGLVHRLPHLLPGEPVVQDSIAAGADLVLFSGDKLFGGPQAGLIVGRAGWVDRLARHPWMRTMRVDKLTLAALEATLELHLSAALDDIPVFRMLTRSSQELQQRAHSLHETLLRAFTAAVGGSDRCTPQADRGQITVVPVTSEVGGGAAPAVSLPSHAVALRVQHPERVTRSLRCGQPPILARCEHDRVLLDVRTVEDAQIDAVARRVASCLVATT
ncbi:MAG: L-seryl-tRNA(Sec) selenium transferase [Pirellulaceae bacterium]|nr:MAG: L-seryl-tRNA(Sec) selenium transferase [Pirellulaceae bacterium]